MLKSDAMWLDRFIPDYRQDTGADAFWRVAPRIVMTLLGVLVAAVGFWFERPGPAFYNFVVVGTVLAFLGARGFWLPVRPLQTAAAIWLVISTLAFGLSGKVLALTLVLATAVLLVTVWSGPSGPREQHRDRVR
jgi:hypothetical protein